MRLQTWTDLREQLVAVVVPERVVDLPEPVEVDQQQSRRRTLVRTNFERPVDTIDQQGPTWKTHQRVVQRVMQGACPLRVQQPSVPTGARCTQGDQHEPEHEDGREELAMQRLQPLQVVDTCDGQRVLR